MLIGQGMSRLTARYCLSFLILTKDLSTHLAFISNLSYFYVRKRIFIRHSESCLFLRKKETTFFLSSLHSQYLPFYFLFYIFMHFAFCLFTNHYSFNISDLLSGKARTTGVPCNFTHATTIISSHDGINKDKECYFTRWSSPTHVCHRTWSPFWECLAPQPHGAWRRIASSRSAPRRNQAPCPQTRQT